MAKRFAGIGGGTAPLAAIALAAIFGFVEPACSSTPSGSGFTGGDDASVDATTGEGGGNDGATFGGDGEASMLRITPMDPTVDVTITDGMVTAAPLTMVAEANGTQVTA